MDIIFSLANIFSWVDTEGGAGLFGAIAMIIVVLLGLNFSGKFKTAIEELIKANPTSISNPVVFTIFGVLLFVVSPGPIRTTNMLAIYLEYQPRPRAYWLLVQTGRPPMPYRWPYERQAY